MKNFFDIELIKELSYIFCGGMIGLITAITLFILDYVSKRIGKLIIVENGSDIEYEKHDQKYGGY